MKLNGNLVLNTDATGELQNTYIQRVTTAARTGMSLTGANNGLVVFDTDLQTYYYRASNAWVALASGGVAFSQTEGDALEASIGAAVSSLGVFQASAFSGFTNVTTPTDITNVLSQLDSAISGKDQLSELTDVTITGSAAGELLFTTGANAWVNYTLAEAGIQPADAFLTSIATLGTAADKMIYTTATDVAAETPTTSFGRGLLNEASASTLRTTLSLVPGTNVQVYDAFLTSIATLGTAADKIIYTTGVDTAAETTLGAYARTNIINQTSEANFKASVNLEIGVDVQAYDADLTTIAALTPGLGNIIVGTGSVWQTESGATAQASLGLAIGTDVQGYDAGLAALAAAGTGIVSMSGDTVYFRSLTSTGTTITVSNADGTGGNINVDLPNVGSPVSASFVKITTDAQGRVSATTPVVVGDITGLVNSTYVNVTGDTMTGNLTMSGAGVQVVNPNAPSSANDLTNKAYVDALVVSGTNWKSPVVDPDIQDVVAATGFEAAAFALMSDGQTYTYIASAGLTFAGQGGGTSYVASTGDVVTLEKVGSVGNWSFVDNVNAGDRYIIAGEHGTVGATLYGVGFRKNDLIKYVSGAVGTYASWTKPEDAGYQVINFTAAKASGDATGLTTSTTYDLNVDINGTNYNVTVTGAPIATFGGLATTLTTSLNAAYAGSSAVLEPEGHFHIFSGDLTKVIIKEGTGANPLLAGLSTNFDLANIRSNILAGIGDGDTVLVNDPQSKHYAHTYVYTSGINSWTEISGPGAVGAGVGLAYAGTTLNVQLGAGIVELPTDEVGLDIVSGKAVQLTSSLTGGQLTFVIDGSTLTQSGSGLKVPTSGITELELATSVAGAGLAGGAGTALSVNVDNSSIEINSDTLRVKATGITNAMLAGSIAAGKLTVADGKFIVGNVSNVGAEVTMTGDVTFDNAGVSAISSNVIVNADINSSAAIAFSKLATLASANILVGSAGGVATSVAMSGDVTIDNLGATTIGALKVTNGMLAGSIDNSKLLNSSITIAGDSGSDAVALGETFTFDGNATQGVSTSMAANTLSVTVADATVSTKGVASFNTSHFSVSSGAVSLAASLDDLSNVTGDPSVEGQLLVNNGSNQMVPAMIQFVYDSTLHGGAATTHTVTHSLGQQYCNVTVVDASDEVIIPQSITFTSTSALSVVFNSSIQCKVIVMGVAGVPLA